MLRLTRKLMFAIEAVVDIAYNSGVNPVQSRDIAERQGIPRRYLEQVLQQLVRADVLRGVRGPRGGYRLARERRRISLGEIVRIVAGMDTEDGNDEDTGSDLGRVVLQPLWQEMEEEALVRLDSVSIEALCRTAREAGIDSRSKKSIDFTI
ncbi:MAG: Rrf2 family transcriptional regulator [Alphaproteobacteria bacterium]|nr:Rrf2 family transcriptional regulator [Alphaproteobacteria bacterium]